MNELSKQIPNEKSFSSLFRIIKDTKFIANNLVKRKEKMVIFNSNKLPNVTLKKNIDFTETEKKNYTNKQDKEKYPYLDADKISNFK